MAQSTVPATELRPFTPGSTRTGPMLVAVGGSDAAAVVKAAHALAPHSSAGVLAIAVLEPLSVFTFGGEPGLIPDGFELEREASRLAQLRQLLTDATGGDPGWQTRVLYGDPPNTIAQMARDAHAPLVVMGIGRHRPLDRILGVETTPRTIRHSPCPVLAVHDGLAIPFGAVVVATDFSPTSARATEVVLPLLARGAKVHLVHVWQPMRLMDGVLAPIDEQYRKGLPERFRRFEQALGVPEYVSVIYHAEEGEPVRRILAYAEATRPDVIVAGRHGRHMLGSLLVGRTTTALLRGARTSVLVAPEPAFADVDRLQLLLTGTSESRDARTWASQLLTFTRRNRGRRTVVEIDDPALGAQVLERGYMLLGAAYDPRDRRVELMLGEKDPASRRVTRSLSDVDAVAVAADARGRDVGLRIRHDAGQTLLTFLTD